jgi:hypothetical protein
MAAPDGLIEYMQKVLVRSFELRLPETYASAMGHLELLIDEHRRNPCDSRLKELVPSVSVMYTHLPLQRAWLRYDSKYAVSQRHHVGPSFNEIRHTLNLAQVVAFSFVPSLSSRVLWSLPAPSR